jgi:hypothetical protein
MADRKKLANGKVLRRPVNKRHNATQVDLGFHLGEEKGGLGLGLPHDGDESGFSAVGGPELHDGDAGVANAGRVVRECVCESVRVHKVVSTLARPGGRCSPGGDASIAADRAPARFGSRWPKARPWTCPLCVRAHACAWVRVRECTGACMCALECASACACRWLGHGGGPERHQASQQLGATGCATTKGKGAYVA